MRNNFGNANICDSSPQQNESTADASPAGGGAGAGVERDVFVPREAGGKEGEQGEGGGGAGRFRWVVRVASRVSKVGRRARGRVARIVGDETTAEGQQQEDL